MDVSGINTQSQDFERRSLYSLPSFRFVNIVRIVIFIDWMVSVTFWLTGGHGDYFVDNIIHFNFYHSVFDVIILTTLRNFFLWIVFSWLEDTFLLLLDDPYQTSLKFRRNMLYSITIVFSFASLVFVTVKGGLIFNLFFNDSKYSPMHLTYNLLIGLSVLFCVIELALSIFSRTVFRKLAVIRMDNIFQTTHGDVPSQTKKKVDMKRLFTLAKGEVGLLTCGIIFLCISSAGQMVAPLFFGKVVDAAQNSLSIYIGGSLALGAQNFLFTLAGQRIVAKVREDVFATIIKQEIAFFDTNRTGELTNRLSSDTQVIQNALTINISLLTRYSLQIVGSVILMFMLSPALTGVLLAVVPIISIGTVQYGKYVKSLRQEFQDELALASATAEETISNIRTVKMFSSEGKSRRNYNSDINKSYQIGKKLSFIQATFTGSISLFAYGGITLVLWYGGKLLHDHTLDKNKGITAGVLTSFLLYTLQVALAFAFLSNVYGEFMQAVGASVRIFTLMDRQPEVNNEGGCWPQDLCGGIIFKDVSFTYPSRSDNQVLKKISFHLESGQVVALVGPSGGGKSTIVNLIERFYDPDSGEIILGDEKLKKLDPRWFRQKISIVSQEPVLFACSIKDNIAYGRDAEWDEIIEAAKQANAHEFIMSFDKQYDTLVGERGVRLSGGQKQRVAIARALLMNPKILLLDEATSALDSESERLVQEAIDHAMKGRTVLVVAHRLSTVRNADKVMVIDQGRIVEEGTHDTLLQQDGVYKKLVYHQLAAGMPSDFFCVDEK